MNFVISCSSLVYVLTVLIPLIFSPITPFIPSTLSWDSLKIGDVILNNTIITIIKRGIITKKILDKSLLIWYDINIANINIIGAWSPILTVNTIALPIESLSFVILVSIVGVENLSKFLKEKFNNFLNISFWINAVIPYPICAATYVVITENAIENSEKSNRYIPFCIICSLLFVAIPLSIILDITLGDAITIIVSNNVKNNTKNIFNLNLPK